MSNQFELTAEAREDIGKGASRRLRREQGKIPAVVYGAGKDAQALTMEHDAVMHALENEAFYSSIISLKVGKGRAQNVILKDVQRHAYKPTIMHVDFLRVRSHEVLTVHAPIHFLNEETAVGVKEGGALSKQLTEIEISCLPKDLPEFIEVDVAKLEMDQTLHLSAIILPEGVDIVALKAEEPNDMAVASIHMPKVASEDPEDVADSDTQSEESVQGDDSKDSE